MSESWFELSLADQSEALEVAAARSGRPAHLLEKDIWVVWALSAIYASSLGDTLTFKGGTSLSKAYKVIDRFSEDIDLTYDIRELVPDLLRDGNPIPTSASQEKKVTSAVRSRLPQWIEQTVRPVIEQALVASGLQAELVLAGKASDKLIISYPAFKNGTGYAAAAIQLEFGARSTGEPHQRHHVVCDIAPFIDGVSFPTAQPLVMAAQRTFWEKATAATSTAYKVVCVGIAIHAIGMISPLYPKQHTSIQRPAITSWRGRWLNTNPCFLLRKMSTVARSIIFRRSRGLFG